MSNHKYSDLLGSVHRTTHKFTDYFGIEHTIEGSVHCNYDMRTDTEIVRLFITDNGVTTTKEFPRPDMNLTHLLYESITNHMDSITEKQKWNAEVMYKGALTPWGKNQ